MAQPRDILTLYKAQKGAKEDVDGPLRGSGKYVAYKMHTIKNVWGKGKVRYYSQHVFKTKSAAKNFLKRTRKATHKVSR